MEECFCSFSREAVLPLSLQEGCVHVSRRSCGSGWFWVAHPLSQRNLSSELLKRVWAVGAKGFCMCGEDSIRLELIRNLIAPPIDPAPRLSRVCVLQRAPSENSACRGRPNRRQGAMLRFRFDPLEVQNDGESRLDWKTELLMSRSG